MKSMSKAEFDKESQRQCPLVAEADSKDPDLQEFMEDAFESIGG